MLQRPATLFKKKIIPYTIAQTGLLSFLLILSFALRLIFYPLSYLESAPIYYTVAFFFLFEMLQFLHIARKSPSQNAPRLYRRTLWLRLLLTAAAATIVSTLLSEHKAFTASLFALFFIAETAFDAVFFSFFAKED